MPDGGERQAFDFGQAYEIAGALNNPGDIMSNPEVNGQLAGQMPPGQEFGDAPASNGIGADAGAAMPAEQDMGGIPAAADQAQYGGQSAQPEEAQPVAASDNAEMVRALIEQNRQLQAALLARQDRGQPEQGGLHDQNASGQAQPPEAPVPDWDSLYDDEAALARKKQDYANKMAEYTTARMMRELAPTLQYAEQAKAAQERAAAIQELSAVPELKGIGAMQPQLDRFIEGNKHLRGLPASEAYANAYALMKGIEALRQQNAPPQQQAPTPEQLIQLYRGNPQFQQLIEQERIAKLQGAQQVPKHMATGSAANAALNVPKRPASFDEARAMFGAQ